MKRFNPSSKHPARAVQAWQILVSAAMNRQTLTYKRLARLSIAAMRLAFLTRSSDTSPITA